MSHLVLTASRNQEAYISPTASVNFASRSASVCDDRVRKMYLFVSCPATLWLGNAPRYKKKCLVTYQRTTLCAQALDPIGSLFYITS